MMSAEGRIDRPPATGARSGPAPWRRWAGPVLVSAAMLLAACGSDDGDTSAETVSTMEGEGATDTSASDETTTTTEQASSTTDQTAASSTTVDSVPPGVTDYTRVMTATGPAAPDVLYGIYRQVSEGGAAVTPAQADLFRIWIREDDTIHSVIDCNGEFTLGVQTGLIIDQAASTIRTTGPSELEEQMSDGNPCRVFVNMPVPVAYSIAGLRLTIAMVDNVESVYEKVADEPGF
ncbi:MAG: hypothetical protein ACK5RL_16165 [Acidimicrobiales bacterium]